MKGNVEAVCCEFKYSGVGAGLLSSAALATLAIVAATPYSGPLRAALALWVLGWAVRAARSLGRVHALRLDPEGYITLELARGVHAGGAVCPGSFVAPWLTIVRWRPPGARFDRTVMVLPGMLTDDCFRRLRVLLRFA